MDYLVELLSSAAKAGVCRQLFKAHAGELHLRELARRSGCSFSAVQREVERLARQKLLLRREDGNRAYFRANDKHPFYTELCGLVRKSSGLPEALRDCLSLGGVQVAFIFGSVAAGTEKPLSDVDLMVLGTASPRAVMEAVHDFSLQFNREVNPHVMRANEFARRLKMKDHFLSTVMREPKLFVIGNDDELARMA